MCFAYFKYEGTVELGNMELFGCPKNFSLMPKVPYPCEVNGKLVTGNDSLIPICFLSNRSLLTSLTVFPRFLKLWWTGSSTVFKVGLSLTNSFKRLMYLLWSKNPLHIHINWFYRPNLCKTIFPGAKIGTRWGSLELIFLV